MLTKDAIKHFGSIPALAAALDIKPPSIHDWKEHVPPRRQYQLERITKGKLKATCDLPKKKAG